MRKALIVFSIGSILVIAYNVLQVNTNQHYVNGRGGGYYRTNPNSTKSDNKSTNASDILFGIFAVGIGTIILFGSIIPWFEENIFDKKEESKQIETLDNLKIRLANIYFFNPKEIKLLDYKWHNISEALFFLRENTSQNIVQLNCVLLKTKYNFFKNKILIYFISPVVPNIEFYTEIKINNNSTNHSNKSINNLLEALQYNLDEINDTRYKLEEKFLFKIGQQLSIFINVDGMEIGENKINIIEYRPIFK